MSQVFSVPLLQVVGMSSFKCCLSFLHLQEFSVEIERLQRDLEATQQRSGIYLDQAEYDNMLLMLDQLEGDIKSKDQEMTMLEEELNKKLVSYHPVFVLVTP